jgi:glycosyltransferase involved in cell wall biosynthesis
MSLPLVSVVIPFYNVEKFLKETIDSVINQDYTNWQLVLVDDGSSDKSTAIAKEYARNFSDRILYLNHSEHKNKGVCATRNLGVKFAIGEWIAFLDSDDIWTKEKLSRQVAHVLEYPEAAMLCEASLYWKSWDHPEKEDRIIPVGIEAEKLYYPPFLALNLYPLKKAAAPCPSSILIKKSTLDTIGGFEETFVGPYSFIEDQAFLFKVYLNAPVFVSADCNNLYRLHDKSVMAQARDRSGYKQKGMHFFLRWAKAYVKHQKINNKELNEVLNNALAAYRYVFLRKVWRRVKSTFT